MASGAGQNVGWWSNLLPFVAGPNDASAGNIDSGAVFFEARAFTKYTVSMEQDGSDALNGWQVQVQYSNDKRLYYAYLQTLGSPTQAADLVAAYPNAWNNVPGPSEQTGTGSIANPMTVAVPLLVFNGPVVCLRVIASGGTQGYIRVPVEASP